ncbi:MAG TPA: putative Ig domain-containing protein, partial [Verrucomicrobiae bacterium]
FNNGAGKENLLVGTVAQPCERISVINNCAYFDPGASGTGIRLGYGALNNTGATVQDNYVVNGSTSLLMNEWTSATIKGNFMLGSKQRLVQISQTGGFTSFDYLCNDNTYSSTYGTPFYYSDAVGLVNFAQWKTVTGYDANSPLGTSLPTQPKVFVRPNQYERGRAHVAVFNWALQPAVAVDLSAAGLNVGESYEIRDGQNYFGRPVASGAYDGSPVTLPMNLTEAPPLVGNVTHILNRHTGTDFGVFVVVPVPAAAGPNTPPVLASITNRVVHAGSRLTLTAAAADADLPAQRMSWSLDPGYPTGAAIDPSSGVFDWTPTKAQTPGAYTITVHVTDSGTPALSATRSFTIIVLAELKITAIQHSSGVFTLTWNSISNRAYQLQSKDGLNDPAWTSLGNPVTALGLSASATDSGSSSSRRFYRVLLLP